MRFFHLRLLEKKAYATVSDLRNKTTSEFRTVFRSPLGVPIIPRFHCIWYVIGACCACGIQTKKIPEDEEKYSCVCVFFTCVFKKKHKRNKIIVAYAFFLHAFVRKKRIRNCIVELRMCVTYAPSY